MTRLKGFTLLELLIGLALLGFVLVLLFSGFRLASDSWDAVDSRSSRTTDDQIARAFVRRVISQLQPMRWKRALDQPLAFIGEPDRLSAIVPVSGQAGHGGLKVIELLADSAGGAHGSTNLVLRQAPLRYDSASFADGLAEVEAHKILGGVGNLRFSYFGPPRKGEPPQWFDSWPNREDLPQLVRVNLDSGSAGWSDVLVAPMVSTAGCRWNAFYKKCMPGPG